jgi:hypothetical protein
MPMYEFVCPAHGKFEKFMHSIDPRLALCEKKVQPEGQCGLNSPRADSEVPAKRNPEHGIQR